MYVWVSICVHRRVAKEGVLSLTFLTSIRLSILARLPHKELCPREPARQDAGHWESRVRFQSRQPDIQAQDIGLVSQL